MTEGQGSEPGQAMFAWHPDYVGRSVADVQASLAEEIARDQRAYELAMEGAEHSEGASLTAIVDLERRWSPYDFDWAEMDAGVLAERVARFQWAREERREMFPFAEYRSSGAATDVVTPPTDASGRSLPIMKIGAIILIVLVVIFVVAVLL